MAQHVDIVKSDPLAGTAQVVARVVLDDGGHIEFEAANRDYWREALTRAVSMEPTDDPERFLVAVSERMDGTYLFASEPHDEHECERPLQVGDEYPAPAAV